jgi:hypothetical protein
MRVLTPFGLGTLLTSSKTTESSSKKPKRYTTDEEIAISTVNLDWGEAHLSRNSIRYEIPLDVVVFSEPFNGQPFTVNVAVDANIAEMKKVIAAGHSGIDPIDMLLCVKGKRLEDGDKVSDCIGSVNSAGKFAPILCIVDENPADVFKTLLKIFSESLDDQNAGIKKFKAGRQRRIQWTDALNHARHTRNLKNLLDSLESFISPVCFKLNANWEAIHREWMGAVRRSQSISELSVWFEYLARNILPEVMMSEWNLTTRKDWTKRVLKLAIADRAGLVALLKSCTLAVGDYLKRIEPSNSSFDSEESRFGVSSLFFSSFQEEIMRLFRGREFNLLSRIQLPSAEDDNLALSKSCARYLACVLENLAENDPEHCDLQKLTATQDFTSQKLSQTASFVLSTIESIDERNFVPEWTDGIKDVWNNCLQKVIELEEKYAISMKDNVSPKHQMNSSRSLFKDKNQSQPRSDNHRSLLRNKIRERIRDLGSGGDLGFSRLISSVASSQQELESEENSSDAPSSFRFHSPSLIREGSSLQQSAPSSGGSRSVSDLARSLMLQDMMEILAMAEAEAASFDDDEFNWQASGNSDIHALDDAEQAQVDVDVDYEEELQ